MQDFYIRTDRHWIKVSRSVKDKSFTFALGYKGDFKAFRMVTLGKPWMKTIKDAKEHAQFLIDNENY